MDKKVQQGEETNVSGVEKQDKRLKFVKKVLMMLKDEQDDLLSIYENVMLVYQQKHKDALKDGSLSDDEKKVLKQLLVKMEEKVKQMAIV